MDFAGLRSNSCSSARWTREQISARWTREQRAVLAQASGKKVTYERNVKFEQCTRKNRRGGLAANFDLEPSLDAYAAPHRQRCASSKALLGISEESKAKRPRSVGSEARAAAAADRR